MKENFEKSLELVLKHEGGFVNHPQDPGGMTNLGVTKKVWDAYIGRESTEAEMRALTKKDVAPLYRKNYWGELADGLPNGVDYLYFDFAVNAGPRQAAKTLQTALGVIPDGIIGPITLQAIRNSDANKLIDKFSSAKEAFYRSLKTFPVFGNGWLRRVKESAENARKMV